MVTKNIYQSCDTVGLKMFIVVNYFLSIGIATIIKHTYYQYINIIY